MSKKLSTEKIASELSSSAFFRPAQERAVGEENGSEEQMPATRPQPEPTARPTTRKPRSQSASQSSGQSTNQPSRREETKIVDRPKAFYITERLDSRLDEAVLYFQKRHGIKKADRSVVINALLDTEAVWNEDSLDQLVDRVIRELTNRLMR